MFKLVNKYLKDYIFYIIGAVVLVLIQSYIQVVLVMGEMHTILDKGVKAADMSIVYASSTKMLIYTVLLGLCAVGLSYLTSKFAGIMMVNIREDCYSKIMNMSMDEFDHYGLPWLLSRTVSDPRYILTLIQFTFSRIVMLPVATIFVLIITYLRSKEIFIVYVISLIVTVAVMAAFRIVSQKYYVVYRRMMDKFTKTIGEKITGVRTIRAFGCETIEEQKGFAEDEALMKAAIKCTKPLCIMDTSSMLVLNWTSMAIFIVASKAIQNGVLTVNNMVFLLQYLNFTITILGLLPSLINITPKAMVSANQIWEIINSDTSEKTEIIEDNSNKEGSVEFRDVTFKYQNGQKVLSNISFTLKSKETLAIVGATGSGKTTLLNLMIGLHDVTEGDILVDGISISKYQEKDLLNRFSYSSQKNYILEDTVRNNLTALHDDLSEEAINKACKCACFDTVVENLPDGFETKLLHGGTNLSGGQCKRLMLARTLLKESEIYLFDEPFAALDSVTESKVRNNINELLKDKTKVIVTSKLNSISHADHILVLDFGRVVGYGTHEELLESCDIYKDLHELQKSLDEEAK